MGSDDEDWTPKPVKPKKFDPNNFSTSNQQSMNSDKKIPKQKIDDINTNIPSLIVKNENKIKLSNKYHVTLNGDARIISASNLDDIIQNIKTKYALNNLHQIRINYWSDEYHEWIFLDTFPPENTKLQVILMEPADSKGYLQHIKTEKDLSAFIRNEIIKYLENPLNISKHMNQAFKNCIDANNSQHEALNYYETSVLYITKRYNQNHSSPTKQILHLQEKQQKLIDKLIEETEELKIANKNLKTEIDDMKDAATTNVKSAKKSNSGTSKSRCSIM